MLVTDDVEVIAGHGRLLAARQLGLNEVPVIRLSHLTPEQVRAYRIADNQLVLEPGWDEELLAAELHALNAAGFDLGLTGFERRGARPSAGAARRGRWPGRRRRHSRAAGEPGVAPGRSVAAGRSSAAVRRQHQGGRRHPRHAQPEGDPVRL